MAKLSILQLLRSQFTSSPPPVKRDLSEKTVVVVGANGGIGFEAAKHFARMGPGKLILACRDAPRGHSALLAIQEDTGFQSIEVRLIDLAKFDSVADFATKFEQEEKRLDILVYNAAIATQNYEITGDGWERSLQTNDLSCALLSILLLPIMSRTASSFSVRPRIVIVASEVHFWAEVNDEELSSPKILEKASDKAYCKSSVMSQRYFYSKLLDVFLARELTNRLPPTSPLIVSSVNPGFCVSSLNRDQPLLTKIFFWSLSKLIARTAEQGSRQLVWAANGAPEKKGAEAQRRIWDEMVDILAQKYPRVKTTVEEHLVST